jgi:replicative DNA helicase
VTTLLALSRNLLLGARLVLRRLVTELRRIRRQLAVEYAASVERQLRAMEAATTQLIQSETADGLADINKKLAAGMQAMEQEAGRKRTAFEEEKR